MKSTIAVALTIAFTLQIHADPKSGEHAAAARGASQIGAPIVVAGQKVFDLSDRAVFPIETIEVKEPHSDQQVEVTGAPFKGILETLKSKNLLSGETHAFFWCKDGYVSNYEIKDLASNRAFVATNIKNDEKFFDPHLRTKFDWAPGYVVWEQPDKVSEFLKSKSPYQVTKITFAKLSDENSAEPQFDKSNRNLLKFCLSCHQMNGWGGTKARPFEQIVEQVPLKRIDQILAMNKDQLTKNGIPMPAFGGTSADKKDILTALNRIKRRKNN
jgi:hypothetical protein